MGSKYCCKFEMAWRGHTRIIERNPVIFHQEENFYVQIFGSLPEKDKLKVCDKLRPTLLQFLPEPVTADWIERFRNMELSWNQRKEKALSSGEQIVLSFGSALSFWDSRVRFLVSDECDASLDNPTRHLYFKTLKHLAKKYAIYYVSHAGGMESEKKVGLTKTSVMTEVYMLGCTSKKHKGVIIPLRLSALYPGSGKVRYSGNISESLHEIFLLVQRAMIHSNQNLNEIFSQIDFHLDCYHHGGFVGQTRS